MWWRHRVCRSLLVVGLLVAQAPGSHPVYGESPETALEEALAVLQDGDIGRARELLEAVVDEWPGYRRAHYHLGRLAFDRGDLEESSKLFQTATEGEFPRAFSAWYYLGRTRILQREFTGAVEALDAALERAPEFSLALMERGRARLFMGDVEAGLADLHHILEAAEPPGQAAVLTGQLLVVLGRNEEARAVAQALKDRSQDGDRSHRRAEWLLAALNPNPQGWAELAGAIGDSPEAGDLYWALGELHLGTHPQHSAMLFRIALDHDSENPVSWLALERLVGQEEVVTLPDSMPNLRPALLRSRRLWEEGRHEEGRQIALRLLDQRPHLVPALLLLAQDAERREDLWQATWIYEQLLDWLGPIPSFGRRLAEVAQTMGAEELAMCGAHVALYGESQNGALYYLLGAIESDRGETEAAIEAYERALELGHEDVRIWLRLGELHFEQMEISASIEAYEGAMSMDPAAAEAVRPFALSSLTTEQYASVREILEKHIEQHPESINTLYSLGVMSLRDNHLEEAKTYFLRLAEVAPDHRQVHYNLGQILLRQGDTAAGQAEMKSFRQIKAAEDEEWEVHNQAHFRRVEARKLTAAGQPEQAIPLYAQSVSEGAAELSDYLELAAANLAVGRVGDALEGYEGILSSYPYHHAALEGLIEAARESGEQPKLEDAVRKLKILDWPCKMTSSDPRGDP